MHRALFFAFVVLLFATSCRESEISPDLLADGRQYFNLAPGTFKEYQVEKVVFNELATEDTLRFQLREEIAKTFELLGGGTGYRLERFTRAAEGQPWQLDSIWTARFEKNTLVQVKNNVPYIKLSLPIFKGKEWNGNALNTLPAEIYRIDSLGLQLVTGDSTWGRAMQITLRDSKTLVDKSFKREFYAFNTGLVSSFSEDLEYISELSNPFYGQDSVLRGEIVRQYLLRHGQMEP